jgi:arylsulfatase A-like enzyme
LAVVAAVGVAAAAIAGGARTASVAHEGAPAAAGAERPNIVLVMTDDQTLESMRVMHDTRRLLAERGTTFEHAFATYPLCCPSRATLLTGQYSHNHSVQSNGSYDDLRESQTLPVWLRRSGYHTGHVGRYLNGYGIERPRRVPPGWHDWYGLTGGTEYDMFGFDLNVGGRIVHYGRRDSDYQTDVLADRAAAFIERRDRHPAPFFLSVAAVAPHSGNQSGFPNPIPAPRHRGRFGDEPLPRPPSFDEADVSDKPLKLQSRPRLSDADIRLARESYRSRLASLLAVDDLVERLVHKLARTGQLESTLFLFTSDNGFFHGEHRYEAGKVRHYEESTRIPLLMRGPGVPAGVVREQLAANVDLAPTLVDAAGADTGIRMDGLSLLPLAKDPAAGSGRDILLQAREYPRQAYVAVRTPRYVYAEYTVTGEQELYDLAVDPYQLESRHDDPAYEPVRLALAERLDELRRCAGESCRTPRP